METTFLLADLAGFAALTEAHGDVEAAIVAEEFFEAVRRLLPAYDGEEVKVIGDAVLVHLTEAASAVHLAARLLGDYGARHRGLGVRVGIHTGTAVRRGDDWFGGAVNITTRVADLAGPGEAVITASTATAAAPSVVADQLRLRGSAKLKNIREEVVLFELVLEGKRPGLAVDPVCRMAVDPAQSYSAEYEGVMFHFCSEACGDAFAAQPAAYL